LYIEKNIYVASLINSQVCVTVQCTHDIHFLLNTKDIPFQIALVTHVLFIVGLFQVMHGHYI